MSLKSGPHSLPTSTAERYRARMLSAITGSPQLAMATARSWGTPNISRTDPCSSGVDANCCSKNCSPSPGVCQILAKSCHSNSTSPIPAASLTQDRTRSGRVLTTRTTKPAAPVVADQVDGAVGRDRLELGDEPLHVLLLRGAESLRSWAPETRELGRDDISAGELRSQVVPDGGCLGDTMDEDDRHGGSLAASGHALKRSGAPRGA